MLRSVTAICLFCGLVACASVRDHSPALPALGAISCCWLLQEKIELVELAKTHRFTSAVSIQKNRHVLVLFDGLGNKVFASTRTPNSTSVDMDKSDGKIPVHILWAAINLVHAPADAWPQTNRRWRIIETEGMRILRHHSSTWAQARFNESGQGMTNVYIHFPSRNIRLEVNSMVKQSL